jgi:hypothetical protein
VATYATDSGTGDFQLVPQGTHIAICDMFVDLGLQDSNFGAKHKIYIRWQIPKLRLKYELDGKQVDGPMTIGGMYTLSLSDKSNLRPMLEAWRGQAFTSDELKKFDVSVIAGKPCMVTITHRPDNQGKVRDNVTAVAKLLSGTRPPKLEGDLIVYDADNTGSFDKLRPWLQDKIKNALRKEDRQGKPDPNDPDGWRSQTPQDDDDWGQPARPNAGGDAFDDFDDSDVPF